MGGSSKPSNPQKVDYLREALALERQGDYDAALTSYRLALRDQPANFKVLQNMAIAYTKMGQIDQAIKCYRGALDLNPHLSGAHYGIAFLLLKKGETMEAARHLDSFLMDPPNDADAERWLNHARETLDAILRKQQEGDGDLPVELH